MIPLVLFRKPLLTMVVIDGLTLTGLFWLFHSGMLTRVIATDFTYLALTIFAIFTYVTLSLTNMSRGLGTLIEERNNNASDPLFVASSSLFYTGFDVVAFTTVMLPTLGFLGTVIGLSSMMNGAHDVQIDTFSDFIGSSSAAALFPTMVGITAFLILSLKRFILMHSHRIHGLAREL